MKFFRRSLSLDQLTMRPARAADLRGVQQLYRGGTRRFLGCAPEDVPLLLDSRPAVVLLAGDEIVGVMLSGWQARSSGWLRGFALGEGLSAADGARLMFPLLREQLCAGGVERLFYAGDDSSDRWLQPVLVEQGFAVDTEVVVYEKRDLRTPSVGNTAVRLRPASPLDLDTVLDLDGRCFDEQWAKGQEIIAPALRETPFFVIAELENRPVGYAFATAHFNGKLLHLVRIAVDPSARGQGIGVRLLADLVAFAARGGTETITLNTQTDNQRSQRLYRWFGFQLTGERQIVLRADM
jgi:[ribosomal protein S18]-alanine N-acetyltransferase